MSSFQRGLFLLAYRVCVVGSPVAGVAPISLDPTLVRIND